MPVRVKAQTDFKLSCLITSGFFLGRGERSMDIVNANNDIVPPAYFNNDYADTISTIF